MKVGLQGDAKRVFSVKFRTTPDGRDFVATYKTARIIRDAGTRRGPAAPGAGSGAQADLPTPPAAPQ